MFSRIKASHSEARHIATHAWTVLLGQLAVMAFGIADTLVAGRYSNESLAALSVGSAIYISVYVALIGVVQSLLPIYAEHFGAGRWLELGQQVKQSVYLSLLLIGVGMTAMLMPGALLDFTGVPANLQAPVREYLFVLSFALAPSMWFRLFSTLHQSLGKPRLVTFIQVVGLCIKVPLSVMLTFGQAGLPELGVVGCAWATFIVNFSMLGLAVLLLCTSDFYKPLRLFTHWQKPQPQVLLRMLHMGLPAGLSYMVEVTSFTMMSLYIARMGAQASAAHQIAANLTAVMYMLPLSMAIATSARVSFWIGAEQPAKARAVVHTGFTLLLPLTLLIAGSLALFAKPLAQLYTQDAAVAALAASLLLWVALYHLADAVQALCGFVLRCYRVTVAPFVLYATFLWGLGLGGGYWLSYHGFGSLAPMQSPTAFWMAAAAALWGVAACLLLVMLRAMKRSAKGKLA